MPTPDDARLVLEGITKRFGATVALDDVTFVQRPKSVHALLGENGAGKTTLMRIAFGLLRQDAGRIDERPGHARITSPASAIAAGFGMVHQHFTNVPTMTVAENVALGGHGRLDARKSAQRVREIGERTGLTLEPSAWAGELSVGGQQRLEIVKALARNATLLILDEPTAVLAPTEAEELLRWLRSFADAGNSVVLITHKLREALGTADDITVLRHGRNILTARAADLDEHSLATSLLGEEPLDVSRKREHTVDGEIVAQLNNVDMVDERDVVTVRQATLQIHGGEIVGIAAVEGSGQRELLRALAGRTHALRGDVKIPSDVGFIPEDRHHDALVLEQTSAENITLRGSGRRRGLINWRDEQTRTQLLANQFDVRGDIRAPVRTLSGGNQQKLVVGRELDGAPRLFVVENPTRGLDVRATQAVHDRLRAAAANGAGVVVYSSDLDEVLALASRVVVMYGGRLVAAPNDRTAIGRAMLGVA